MSETRDVTTTDSSQFLPLGLAPLPTTGTDLADRVRTAIVGLVPAADHPALRIAAEVDGADIPVLTVDLTGLVLPEVPQPTSSREPDVRDGLPGIVRQCEVDAHPVTVAGLPVDVRAQLQGVPVRWLTGTDGSLWWELVEPSADTPVTGDVRVAVPRERLLAEVRAQAARAAAAQGVTITQLDIDLVSRGPRVLAVAVRAKLRKGLLSATAQARATATVDDRLVLTLSDVDVSSGNPLVAALLAGARGRIDRVAARPIDLAGRLPRGVRLTDVRIDVGDDVVLTARAS
jgi:hypothetical protein